MPTLGGTHDLDQPRTETRAEREARQRAHKAATTDIFDGIVQRGIPPRQGAYNGLSSGMPGGPMVDPGQLRSRVAKSAEQSRFEALPEVVRRQARHGLNIDALEVVAFFVAKAEQNGGDPVQADQWDIVRALPNLTHERASAIKHGLVSSGLLQPAYGALGPLGHRVRLD